jgi:hypothetical protein
VLEAGEAGVENLYVPLDDGAVLQAVNVSGVDGVFKIADFGAGSVAWDALSFDVLLLGRAGPDAGTVVLEQVLGAVLDAGGAVRVLAVRVLLPLVHDRVVALQARALLFANAVVVKIAACLKK